jgi:hypothetical protein
MVDSCETAGIGYGAVSAADMIGKVDSACENSRNTPPVSIIIDNTEWP